MSLSMNIRRRLAAGLYAAGLFAPLVRLRANKGFPVLMYHRVLPAERAQEATEPGMYVTPQTFEMHLHVLRRHFDIRPLSDLPAHRTAGKRGRREPVCFITFDDGWRDFLEHAFPALEKLGVPATVFLPTAFIGTPQTFWTERLTRTLRRRRVPASSLAAAFARHPALARRLDGLDAAPDERFAAALIAAMKELSADDIEARMAEITRICGTEETGVFPREFLDWDEVRRLKRSGLVEFGSHTETHRILTRLSDGDIDREIHRSKEALAREAASDPGFVAFCFPNGDYDRRILERVQGGGYDLAVSTQAGWNRRDQAAACIRRIGMHEDVSASEPLFLWRLLCGL
jgi:peptidoglycan/xylan/chitin deacetylase (PgdA/CDA1 family)